MAAPKPKPVAQLKKMAGTAAPAARAAKYKAVKQSMKAPAFREGGLRPPSAPKPKVGGNTRNIKS